MIFKIILIVFALSFSHVEINGAPSQLSNRTDELTSMSPQEDAARLLGGEFCSKSYQVALLIQTKNGKKGFCGGSLIAPGWVLTAAHCTEEAVGVKMHFGSVLRTVPHKSANSTEFMQHPQWDSSQLKNDCALIKYNESDVTIDGTNITIVRLPAQSQKDKNFVGEKALVSGWGRESDFAIKPADKLRCLNGKIIENSHCSAPYIGVISQEHICMEGRFQSSTCHGDSGGPLVVTEADGLPTHVGVVSFGPGVGCGWGWPPVFARTTACQPWIMEMTKIEERP